MNIDDVRKRINERKKEKEIPEDMRVVCPGCRRIFDHSETFSWGPDFDGHPTVESIYCPHCGASTEAPPEWEVFSYSQFMGSSQVGASADNSNRMTYDEVLRSIDSEFRPSDLGYSIEIQLRYALADSRMREDELFDSCRDWHDKALDLEKEISIVRGLLIKSNDEIKALRSEIDILKVEGDDLIEDAFCDGWNSSQWEEDFDVSFADYLKSIRKGKS